MESDSNFFSDLIFLVSSGLSSKKAEETEEKSTEQLAKIAKNQALMVMCLQ